MNHGWQSEATDGPKGGWGLLSFSLSRSFSDYLPTYLPIYVSIYLSIYISISLSLFHLITYISIYLYTYIPIYVSTYLPTYLSTYLPIYLSTYLPIYLSTYLPTYLPIYLSISISISLSLSLICLSNYLSVCLSASLKTKLFCETSSLFEVDSIKNETILLDFLTFRSWQHQKRNNSATLPHFSKLTTSKMEMLQNPHVLLTFDKVHNPLRLPRETTSERPKVVRTPGALCVFNMLTSKCASRHNGVHFFDISTSKSGFGVFCAFWRRNLLCATTA